MYSCPARAMLPEPTRSSRSGVGSGASITANVLNVIATIPVTSAGSGYTSPPTITISDGTGSGAVAVPTMAGVQPADVVTYSIGDNCIATAVGYAGKATSASIANYAGQLEPGLGGFYDFGLSQSSRHLADWHKLCRPRHSVCSPITFRQLAEKKRCPD